MRFFNLICNISNYLNLSQIISNYLNLSQIISNSFKKLILIIIILISRYKNYTILTIHWFIINDFFILSRFFKILF